MRRALVAGIVVAGLVGLAVAAVVLVRGDDQEAAPRLADCRSALSEVETRDCYSRTFAALVVRADDPRDAVERIGDAAWSQGGFLLANCHGLMHPVGRAYAHEHDVTLATLMDVLPRSNDPGCAAGFAHGLVTGVAPQLDVRRPREAVAVCDETETRYRRYSCVHGFGHAFMRVSDERLGPALGLCRALGPEAPDCAQGAFHDFWLAVRGADGVRAPAGAERDPRVLCSGQADEFVVPCWYRGFVDNRPPGVVVTLPADVERLCEGLTGVHRSGCVTAGSVIGPPDPADQLILCSGMPRADMDACVRGTKVQNLLGSPTETFVGLIGGCERFHGAERLGCYRWLGRVLTVLTDGAFRDEGCTTLAQPAQEHCLRGAAQVDEPLATFS